MNLARSYAVERSLVFMGLDAIGSHELEKIRGCFCIIKDMVEGYGSKTKAATRIFLRDKTTVVGYYSNRLRQT